MSGTAGGRMPMCSSLEEAPGVPFQHRSDLRFRESPGGGIQVVCPRHPLCCPGAGCGSHQCPCPRAPLSCSAKHWLIRQGPPGLERKDPLSGTASGHAHLPGGLRSSRAFFGSFQAQPHGDTDARGPWLESLPVPPSWSFWDTAPSLHAAPRPSDSTWGGYPRL